MKNGLFIEYLINVSVAFRFSMKVVLIFLIKEGTRRRQNGLLVHVNQWRSSFTDVSVDVTWFSLFSYERRTFIV